MKAIKLIPAGAKQATRRVFDRLQIRTSGCCIRQQHVSAFLQSLSLKPRIAFVKQDVATDLYTDPKLTGSRLVFSSAHRSGPAALFSAFHADFHLVQLEPDPECNVWQFRNLDCGGPATNAAFADARFRSFKKRGTGEVVNPIPQAELAIPCDSIDWSQYDVVISLDFSVPQRIVNQYSDVVWCYLLCEPSMRHYRMSLPEPLFGYDFFLNQRCRFIKHGPRPRRHEIDFPYHLHYYGCFHELMNVAKSETNLDGVFLENRTSTGLSELEHQQLAAMGPVRFPTEELLEKVLRKELASKYYLAFTPQTVRSRIWGNGMIEAVACGCLAFGNPDHFTIKDLFTPFTCIASISDFCKKVAFLEKHPERYEREVQRQRQLLDYLCFIRPMTEIFTRGGVKTSL